MTAARDRSPPAHRRSSLPLTRESSNFDLSPFFLHFSSEPNIALFYALVLNEAAQTDKARRYLVPVQNNPSQNTAGFLPQELELANRLAAKLTTGK